MLNDNRMRCDSCTLATINDAVCHEHGCRNSRSRWDKSEQRWIKQRECRECGYQIDANDPCCKED